MAAGGTRARQTAGLLLLAALMSVILVWNPVAAGAQCVPVEIPPECETTTTEPETTTTEAVTTTTEAEPETTTTVRRTTTTVVDIVEEVTTTTLTVTTSADLLVPGDGTEGAESTTTTEAVTVAAVSDDGPSDGTLIALVVAGLVLIAIAVGVLTWRYWVATRPAPIDRDRAAEPAG